MNSTLRGPSSDQEQREPRLNTGRAASSTLADAAFTDFATREGLHTTGTALPRPANVQVPGVITGLMRKERYADTTLGPVLTASLIAHVVLFTALLWKSAHHNHSGSKEGIDQPSVEMVFSKPQGSSGMTGEPSPDMGSGNNGKTASTAGTAEPEPDAAPPAPAVTQPETPSTPPLPPSDDGLPQPTPEEKQPVRPAFTPAGKTPKATGKTPSASPSHRRPTPHQQKSPFANPKDLSFDEAPAPRRRTTGRPGGSRGPIDLSIGPMVDHGQLSGQYASRASIKGVSDDYAEQISSWIERHKYYPPEAASNGEEGPSSVHVILDRTGRVRAVYQTSSSGSYYLDAATTGMFRGAQLPPVPPDMKGNHFDIDMTMNYFLIRR